MPARRFRPEPGAALGAAHRIDQQVQRRAARRQHLGAVGQAAQHHPFALSRRAFDAQALAGPGPGQGREGLAPQLTVQVVAAGQAQAEAVAEGPQADPALPDPAPGGEGPAAGIAPQAAQPGPGQRQVAPAQRRRLGDRLVARTRCLLGARAEARAQRILVERRQRQPHRRRSGANAQLETQFAQLRAGARRQRPGDAQHQSQSATQRAGQRGALVRAQPVPGALVEHHKIEPGQGGRIQRERRIAELQAGADADLAVQAQSGIDRPAAQVLEFRSGRAGQQQQLRLRLRDHRDRDLDLFDQLPARVAQAQAEPGQPRRARDRAERETAVAIRRDPVDPLPARVEQFDARAGHAVDASVDLEAGADRDLRRRPQADHAARQRRRLELDGEPARGLAVARAQAGAEHPQAPGVGVGAQGAGEVGHALALGRRRRFGQRDMHVPGRGGRVRGRALGRDHHGPGLQAQRRRQQGQVQQARQQRLRREQQRQAPAARARRGRGAALAQDQARHREQSAQAEHGGEQHGNGRHRGAHRPASPCSASK